MPIRYVTRQLWSELQSLPATLVILLGLIAFAYWSFHYQARAETVQGVQSEVREVKKAIDQILTLQLTGLIEDLHQQWCKETDSLRKRSIYRSVQKMQVELRQVSKESYTPTACLITT